MDKKNSSLNLPDEIGHDFEESDFILNYRPQIDYVEPDPEFFESPDLSQPAPVTIDDLRDRTAKLVAGFQAVTKLADLAQKRIDSRVKASGDLQVKLDPVKDAHIVAAMKRKFPNKADPSLITYDDYKSVIDCVQQSAPSVPAVDPKDIQQAKTDPFRTNFGGLNNQQGQNRPEISSPASSVSPLDLGLFQKAGILALFALLYPLIKQEDKKEIIEHMLTVPHKPI